MVVFAAVFLFSWGALSGGFGVYALVAAFESESLFHAVQAGMSLVVATISISGGFLVVVVGGLRRGVWAGPVQRSARADTGGPELSRDEGLERNGAES